MSNNKKLLQPATASGQLRSYNHARGTDITSYRHHTRTVHSHKRMHVHSHTHTHTLTRTRPPRVGCTNAIKQALISIPSASSLIHIAPPHTRGHRPARTRDATRPQRGKGREHVRVQARGREHAQEGTQVGAGRPSGNDSLRYSHGHPSQSHSLGYSLRDGLRDDLCDNPCYSLCYSCSKDLPA